MSERSSDRRIGIIQLNTQFPRLPGDIGNPATFDVPVVYRRVADAAVDTVVTKSGISPSLAEQIRAAAHELEDAGVGVIATSCGFLGELQSELRQAVSVPVVSSALVLLPFLRTVYGPQAMIGVLTFDARALSPHHFDGAYDESILIEGIETGQELYRVISADEPDLDPVRGEADAVAAAGRLRQRAGRLDAVILECTNLSPYRSAIRATAGAPVFDLVQAIEWVLAAA